MSERIDAANVMLATFAQDTELVANGKSVGVRFRNKVWRWQTRGQDFYPVWHRRWAHGGTATTALSQLVRWVQGRPVLPISSWRYWCGDKVQLGRAEGMAAVATLEAAGYPTTVPCVLCGMNLERAGDWWSLDGVSGPSCSHRSGCCQKPKESPNAP